MTLYLHIKYCLELLTYRLMISFSMLLTPACRGHRFKLYKNNTYVRVRSSFFSERVLNAWNKLPESIDFSSLTSFARSVKYIDL